MALRQCNQKVYLGNVGFIDLSCDYGAMKSPLFSEQDKVRPLKSLVHSSHRKSAMFSKSRFCFAMAFLINTATVSFADLPTELGEFLEKGQLKEAKAYLDKQRKQPKEVDQIHFAQGVVQLLTAVEQLGHDQFRYGALTGTVRNIPVFRLGVPVNKNPEELSYADLRKIFVDFQSRVLAAEQTLATIDTTQEVKLPLDLAKIRIDLNGDGELGDAEGFASILQNVNRRRPGDDVPAMMITFDTGDVPWLRGYCHFLAAFCDFVLAYDHQNLFDHCGHLLYRNVVRSKPLGMEPLDLTEPDRRTEAYFLDAVAAIHLMQFPLKEPMRMESARQHLLAMIRTSRESWKLILAEKDDDHEWLPNPKQSGALQIPITQDVIDGWHQVLIEIEDILEGRKLIPFWRDNIEIFGLQGDQTDQIRGINLKRFFNKPNDFDLILTIQGSGMLPYVERGELSTPETWRNLRRIFRGQFFGFAVWFN